MYSLRLKALCKSSNVIERKSIKEPYVHGLNISKCTRKYHTTTWGICMQWHMLSNRQPQSSYIQPTCMCIAMHCLFGHKVTQQRRQPNLLISVHCFHPRKRALAASKDLAKGFPAKAIGMHRQPALLAGLSSIQGM